MNAAVAETVAPEVKVGDFFVESWGYDQTNVNFYKVVGLTKSGKSVKVQEWSSALVGQGGGPQENVVPGAGPATYMDRSAVTPEMDYWEAKEATVERPVEAVTKRLSSGYRGVPTIKTRDWGSWAHKWDGTPQYQTGSGWGH